MIQSFTKETFQLKLHETFEVILPEQRVLLELTECAPLADDPGVGPERREPFSLLFRGPTKPLLLQQIYRITHAELGDIDLFLVPIGQTKTSAEYEVVFG